MTEQMKKKTRRIDIDDDQSTEAVIVKLTSDGTRTRQMATRRKLDARLFEAMENSPFPCERAFERIAKGYLVVTGQVRVKVSRYGDEVELLCGKSDEQTHQEYLADLKRDYLDWANELMGAVNHPDRFIRHAAAIEIIGEGKSAAYVDQTRKKRRPWARDNLIDVLEVFCRMKRWN